MSDKSPYFDLLSPAEGFQLVAIPARQDNYIYLLHEVAREFTTVIDASDAEPVLSVLDQKGWTLDIILNTHHHADHVGGNKRLVQRTGALVAAFMGDRERIPSVAIPVQEGDRVHCGSVDAEVMFIPGHTSGHIAYHIPSLTLLFTGDTLFSLGCGRLFEGSAEQMLTSLKKLAALPGDTRFCCGHEYTEANGRFALTVEPENTALHAKLEQVAALRAAGMPSLPGTLADEVACNPFLRCHLPNFQKFGADELAAFTAIRAMKDAF